MELSPNLRILEVLKKRKSLLWSLSIRQLSQRYRGSVFGFMWTLISPLLSICVYSFVFLTIMKVSMPHYWLYMFNGIIFWNFISSVITESPGGMFASSRLISRAGLPPEMVPFKIVLSHAISLLMVLPIYYLVYFLTLGYLSVTSIQSLLILPLTFMFALGIAFILINLGTLYRDIQQIVAVVTQLLFFTAPVTYHSDRIDGLAKTILDFSPFTVIVQMNAEANFLSEWISLRSYLVVLIWTLGIWAVALTIHKKLSDIAVESI